MPRVPASQQQSQKSYRSKNGKSSTSHTMAEGPSSESDSDEDYDRTQTMTQAERAAFKFSPEVIEQKVADLVQYFLIMEQKKIPVKRRDITKNVLKAEYRTLLSHVLEKATRKLKMAFGIDIVELTHKSGKTSMKVYILQNRLGTEEQGDLIDSSSEDPKVGLLLVILGLIFMSGGSATEAIVWHTLKKLGIKQEEKNHEVFGDVKKLLTSEFASKQMYLEYIRIPNTEPVVYRFKWGIRAEAEVSKRRLLEFVCKMYGNNMELKMWKEQYQEVLAAGNTGNNAGTAGAAASDESDESD